MAAKDWSAGELSKVLLRNSCKERHDYESYTPGKMMPELQAQVQLAQQALSLCRCSPILYILSKRLVLARFQKMLQFSGYGLGNH